ncbi:MAG TPA: zinc ribbon domain-containing protein [Pyrinomonadaceae bacterium]|nr:zinc ribbon domain-containing protein [Pyrinomonadaceae bacterium]
MKSDTEQQNADELTGDAALTSDEHDALMSDADDAFVRAADAAASVASSAETVCPACGASGQRAGARFCATCGRLLEGEDGYLPADALRSSYHYQQRRLPVPPPVRAEAARRDALRSRVAPPVAAANSDGATRTAMAFVTYALVPYLGILFCPGALLLGGIALVRARRSPTQHAAATRAAALSIALGLLILVAQILLWWILYKVPEWTRPGGF